MVVEKFRGLNMFQVQKELAGHEAVIVALFEEEKMSSFVQELTKRLKDNYKFY